MRAYKMLDLKLNDTLLNNIMILGLQHASTRWSRTPIPKNGRSHEETKKQKLVHGLLRHGSGTVRGTDAAGHHHPIAMFIAPAVASFLIATVCMECGITMAWTAYAAVSCWGCSLCG